MQDGIWMEFCKNLDDIEIRQLEENSSYFDYALIQQKERTKTIEINGMSIFRDEMRICYDIYDALEAKDKEWFYNKLMHLLVQIRLDTNTTCTTSEIQRIHKEILNGNYSNRVCKKYQMLDAKVQSMVCEYLWKQEQSGASITLFSEILIQCIHASIYTQSDNRKELLCYIASEKSPELERIVTILIWLFLPMEYKLKPYWGNHFAVIGEAQTMILGQIML